jgi:CRISPR-associated endonuclease/helicase Cas3
VANAREAYEKLKQAHPDWRIELFHARFALCDRLVIESGVLDRFGPKSGQAERQGRVLIATQVVEQSLDLDFDVLITDLAPVDLIIQRAGRLCRHTRDAQGNRIEGDDQRGTPILYVLSPEPAGEINDNWFSGFFPKAVKVYPHHGQLWLTAHLLKEKGKFSMPEDARCLIEGVYGDETQGNIPQGLLKVSDTAEGDALAESSLARQNVLNWAAGYRYSTESRWWDEALTPTRLGEDTITVYLARWQDGVLVPWANVGNHLWQQSAVQIRKKLAASEGEYEAINQKIIEHCKQQLPAKGRWGVLLPLQRMSEKQWVGCLHTVHGENNEVRYHVELGFLAEGEEGYE